MEYIKKEWKSIGFKGYCHYVQNIKTKEKVLISMCWGTVHSDDIKDCNCRNGYSSTNSLDKLKEENFYLKQKLKENNLNF